VVHHHAARARDRSRGRHRLSAIEKHAGRSTITARLRLNYDSNKALSEISSKVNQVRGDLRPEAEIPVINIESADSRFASAYLSFTSDILAANEITDYLNRVVQPRLTAVSGVQRAEILGGRTFAMRVWMKPSKWRRSTSALRRCVRRWRRITTSPRPAARKARWCR
jgi:multidrug efflux pump subunit AcrB